MDSGNTSSGTMKERVLGAWQKVNDVAKKTRVWLSISVAIALGLILGGQFNTSFSVYWAVQQLGLSGKTFSYSMWGGIEKLLQEKTYGIAWALILFSGMWPIVKLIVLLLTAVLPENSALTSSRRHVVISTLCQFGRLSFLDCWIVSLIVLTIRLDEASLPGFNVAFWVQGVAEKGVVLFLAGILLSQLMSNLIITARNKRDFANRSGGQILRGGVVGGVTTSIFTIGADDDDALGADFSVLSSHDDDVDGLGSLWSGVERRDGVMIFKDTYLSSLASSIPVQGVQHIAQALVVILSLLVIVALFVPCLHITYTAAGETFKSVRYSFLTSFCTIASNSHPETFAHSPSPTILSVFGITLVVVVPLLQVVLLTVLWWVPLSVYRHSQLHLVLDNLCHMASMDTFAMALVIVSAEIC